MGSLEMVQRQATRYMLKYIDIPYMERIKFLDLLPLTFVREIHGLMLFYNVIHSRMKVDIHEICNFQVMERRRGRSQQQAHYFNPTRANTMKYENFYSNKIIHIWNSLPNFIKDIDPPVNIKSKTTRFKNALLTFYYNKLDKFDALNTCTWVTICNCRRYKVT